MLLGKTRPSPINNELEIQIADLDVKQSLGKPPLTQQVYIQHTMMCVFTKTRPPLVSKSMNTNSRMNYTLLNTVEFILLCVSYVKRCSMFY